MILIIDDDPSVVASLSLLLKQAGRASLAAGDAREAECLLAAGGITLVIQDMNFSRQTSGEEGLALLRRIKAAQPSVPVLLMTAWGSIALAVEGMKLGAADFITKPWTNTHFLQSIETALTLAATASNSTSTAASTTPAPASSRAQLEQRFPAPAIIGEDPKLVQVLELAARAAPTDAGILITGESGTGKELLAEAVHHSSRRRERPFVKVNLGGISSTLFESEMFGHVRGAFTDARTSRRGRFEAADGGTIFLDEIGELEPASQVKLLRVLQDRTYEPLGSSETRSVDVRIIAATNSDLPALVRAGTFREDLLYRINLIHLRLPALRERSGDIPAIARAILADLAGRHSRPAARLTPKAIAWLKARAWPGNVRQLRQALERAVVLLESDELDAPAFAALEDSGAPRLPAEAGTVDAVERALIERSLAQHGGNITRAAAELGLSRPALYRRMEKHGLETDKAPG